MYPLFLEFLDYIMNDKWIKLVGFSQLTLTDHLYQIYSVKLIQLLRS